MAININIKSDLSIGSFNRPTVRSSVGSGFRPAPRTSNIYGAIENYNQSLTTVTHFQFPNDRPKFYTGMAIQTYSRRDLYSVNASLDTRTQIILPMPDQLSDSHGVEYKTEPFGPFFGAVLNAAGSSGAAGELSRALKGEQTLGEAGKNVLGNITPEQAVGAGYNAATAAGPDFIRQAGEAYAGLSPNDFFTVLLKGPQYKRHKLSWHLVPRNKTEAAMIKRIITILNNSMAPGLALGGAVFNFPKVFQLAFMPNFNYLYKFKPAVLEDMQVDYSPGTNGPTFYHPMNGDDSTSAPESVKISCVFLELEYWLTSDFKDNALMANDTVGTGRQSENLVLNEVEPHLKTFADAYQKRLQEFLDANKPKPDSGGAP